MASYPATFDVDRPEKFQRPQVFIRIIVYIVLSFVNGLAYLGLPVITAIWISQKGGQKFLEEDGPKITGWLRWIMALFAYQFILMDQFPSSEGDTAVRYEVTPSGTPTVGSAILRIFTSIPSAICVGVLMYVSAVIWVIAAIMVLLQETYPQGLYDFQRGVIRWEGRLLAYHASLVGEYPPFALDMGTEAQAATA
jgi:hypothetical protein